MSARTGTENATSAKEPAEAPSVFVHGGRVLPSVTVDTYNEELRDDEGFVGDRASRPGENRGGFVLRETYFEVLRISKVILRPCWRV